MEAVACAHAEQATIVLSVGEQSIDEVQKISGNATTAKDMDPSIDSIDDVRFIYRMVQVAPSFQTTP